jgi:glycerol kinase
VWASTAELAEHWQAERRFEPAMPRAEAERRMAEWDHAVRQATAR